MKSCKTFAAISIFVLITLLLAGTANAEISVALAPSQLHVEENDEFTLDIVIESDVNVSGAEMELAYDPTLIEVIAITEGNFFKQEGAKTIFSKGTIDNELGAVTNIYSVIMGDDMMLDREAFATITLQAKDNSGITYLEMQKVVITNSAGDDLTKTDSVTVSNAEIAVGDVELETQEIDMGAASEEEEESPKTSQNSAILAIIAMCCVYIIRTKQ
nr:cohesin domain-containing protein [uncultured Methanolobus sp.]